MRRLKRAIARANMEREGIQRINKQVMGVDKNGLPKKMPSFFADNWRNYLEFRGAKK